MFYSSPAMKFAFLFVILSSFQLDYSYSALENINMHEPVALTKHLENDLKLLNIPAEPWESLNADKEEILDVAIIGGGMNGLAVSLALIKEGIHHIRVFDENPSGKEGPWMRYARMKTLRSNKNELGPALEIPSLTFRGWYEAQYGENNWAHLHLIPTSMWNDYLCWFKKTLNLPFENCTALKQIIPEEYHLKLIFIKEGIEQVILARKVVLSTGRDGAGGGEVPEFMHNVSPGLYAHTIDPINMNALTNKRVAVVGAGASAFDAAATALEHGALSVDVLIRRETLPQPDKFALIIQPGSGLGFYHLKDETKWNSFGNWLKCGTPPPKETLERVEGYENLNVRFNTCIKHITDDGKTAIISTSQNDLEVDYIILATGFSVDLSHRSELGSIYKDILLWGDQVPEEMKMVNKRLSRFPYLGPHFEFLELHPGKAGYLKNIYCFNYGAFLSHGILSGDIGLSSLGARRLVEGIVIDLFLDNSYK